MIVQKVSGRKLTENMNRIHVALPKPRDNKERPPCIPNAVLQAKIRNEAPPKKELTERDLEQQKGGAGVYSMDWRKVYQLENDEWKFDKIPEIIDGHNIADFIDADIAEKLDELEREEELLEAQAEDGEQEMRWDINIMVTTIECVCVRERESDIKGFVLISQRSCATVTMRMTSRLNKWRIWSASELTNVSCEQFIEGKKPWLETDLSYPMAITPLGH